MKKSRDIIAALLKEDLPSGQKEKVKRSSQAMCSSVINHPRLQVKQVSIPPSSIRHEVTNRVIGAAIVDLKRLA